MEEKIATSMGEIVPQVASTVLNQSSIETFLFNTPVLSASFTPVAAVMK